MGLFSRKSKSKKDSIQDVEEAPIEAQPKKTPARFVPRHGAAGRTYTHDDASSMIHETVSSPPSPSFQRAAMNLVYSEDGYYNDVPAVPSFKNRSISRGQKLHRSSTDYHANVIAYGKQPITAGYYVPHNNSSDSGYESAEPLSAMHSRVPSEHNLHDYSKAYSAHNGTLPELRLDGGSSTLGMEISGTGKSFDNVSPLDLNSDARSIKSNRSVSKRTRFEDDVEPMPSLDQLQQHRKDSDQASSSSPALEPQHDQTPSVVHPQQAQTHAPSPFHVDIQQSGTIPRGSIPSLSVLEGFKVNKKGKILDEEGDPIGELIDGDLLDCVRQRANANGEVLDEYGRVVGHVRTCAPTSGPVAAAAQQDAPETARTLTQESAASLAKVHQEEMAPAVKSTAQLEASKAVGQSQDESTQEPVEPVAIEPVIVQSAPVVQPSPSTQDPKRVSRSASEKSLSELSKPYARPTMSSVPENNVPDDDIAPVSPGMFAYKGDIPVVDGPVQSNRRSKSPPHPAKLMIPAQIMPGQAPGPAHYAKLALVGGHSNSALYPPMRPVSMNSRRGTTQFSGGPVSIQRLPPALKKTSPNGYAFDATPIGSDAGSDPSSSDDGRMLTMGHSRTGSVNTTATVTKPRTYFTHAGKVTVDPETSPTAAAAKPDPTPASVTAEKKKKSRMRMSFGKKSKVAA
ncbi:hypothetical protein Slin15195_G059210 [Septoria linicola]|uniref:Uncharacterized protein n=1 Tax=Septoria linicola TaxID=215465 RepID=A0A9Q9AV88_9PEZI|nr:hypothetical protein Slin14017_G075070 [Septoria linicola]USW52602.1 hypothetical protein Slin15195_G059210 [Septoria linicola]